MANYNISWVPVGSGISISQKIEYKKSVDSTWILHASVAPVTNIAVINGLADNTIYDFKVTSICNFGAPASSVPVSFMGFTCPALTLTRTVDSVGYSFPHPGGSVGAITVNLLSSTGSILQTHTPTIGSPITGAFTGLTPETAYKVRINMTAGSFVSNCTPQDITTDVGVCEGPSNLTAIIA